LKSRCSGIKTKLIKTGARWMRISVPFKLRFVLVVLTDA
jgi:hypothetical protein